MPISPEIKVPNPWLIECANRALRNAVDGPFDDTFKLELSKIHGEIIRAIQAGPQPDWEGRRVHGRPEITEGEVPNFRFGGFEVHGQAVRNGLPFEGQIFSFGETKPKMTGSHYQIFIASCNSSGRIRETLTSLQGEIARMQEGSSVSVNIGFNNCSDGSLMEGLRFYKGLDLPNNSSVNVYSVTDRKMFDSKRGLSCTCTMQNAMIVDQKKRNPSSQESFIVLLDDDILIDPQPDGYSFLDKLRTKFSLNPNLVISSGSFAVRPISKDPFYQWANSHKQKETLIHQTPKPTPYGAMLMIRAQDFPAEMLPTGRFNVNDMYLYHRYAQEVDQKGEGLISKWPSFSFPDVIFYHPGEKDIFDWVRAKMQTVSIFETGLLEQHFDKTTCQKIKDAKIELLRAYRDSVRHSLEAVYGATDSRTLGNVFIYDYFLPQVLHGSEYH